MTTSSTSDLDVRRQATTPPDVVYRAVLVTTVLVSVAAFSWFQRLGFTTVYKDAVSHLAISRRVFDSTSEGLAQLGGVWLPLPHVMAFPLIMVDGLYYSGAAGSIPSMVAYVVTSALVYRCVRHLTGRRLAAVVATAVFALNPNIIYMQSTPMTELPLFACMLGMVYGTQRWIQTTEPRYLFLAAGAAVAGTLTRYEAWVLLALLTLVVVGVSWRRGGYRVAEGEVLAFLYVASAGVIGWLLWNLAIFGHPINFLVGEYSRPSLWVTQDEPGLGDPGAAAATYYYATSENVWLPLLVIGVVGLLVHLVRTRFAAASLPTVAMLGLFAFFVFAIYGGQRPLHVPQVEGYDLYNVRFGLLMVLPVAIGTGLLVAAGGRLARVLAVLALLPVGWFVGSAVVEGPRSIITLGEPSGHAEDQSYDLSREVSAFLAANVDAEADDLRGSMLMEWFGNEIVLFDARLPLSSNIYEGSYLQWEPALADPAGSDIEWVVMRKAAGGGPPDLTYQALHGTTVLTAGYEVAFENQNYLVYREES